MNKVEALTPKTIIEIGVELGGSLKFWEQLVPPRGLVIGVDENPFTPDRITWDWRNSDRVMRLIIGDSIKPETVRKVEESLEAKTADFLFIDGKHDWNHVSGDFENYSQFVKSGGLVGFHDIGSGEIENFFDSIKGRKEKSHKTIGTGIWWKEAG